MITFLKRIGLLSFTQEEVDAILDQPVKIRLYKNCYDEYQVTFFHPLYKKWWVLPQNDINVWIHSPWSLLQQGEYGAYGLFVLTCYAEDIDLYKKKFKTIRDIKNYFDEINKNHFQEKKNRENREKKYPPIID